MEIIAGQRYRHYKNKEYTIIAVARIEETPEKFAVVYRAEYTSPDFGEGAVWIRPLESFQGTATLPDGGTVPRFTLIE